MSSNRRQNRRVDVKMSGVMQGDINADHTDVLMSNLSMGGAFIKSQDPDPKGTIVNLSFTLGDDPAPVVASGTVAWLKFPNPDGSGADEAGMGVQFTDVDPLDLERLKHFIEKIITEDLFGFGDDEL